MKTFSGFFAQQKSLKSNVSVHVFFLFFLTAFLFLFQEVGSNFTIILLPFYVFIIPGYFFAEIFFKQDNLVDKLLIGYGLSTLSSTGSFYLLLFLYNNPIDLSFSRLFLSVLFIESLVFILVDYFRPNKTISPHSKFKIRMYSLVPKHYLILAILFCTVVLGQILFVKIPMYWPDEHQYIYTSRNLLQANYSFTPRPPVMDPKLKTPRYVFIGMNAIFYLFIGFKLPAPQALVVFSSLMLLLATFAVANILYGKKVGLIASLYIAFNPTFWWIARRIVPDMIGAALLWTGIYFMIKVCKYNGTDKGRQYIPITGILLGLTVFVKLTIMFMIPAFYMIFIAFRKRTCKEKEFLFLIGLTGIISFLIVFLVVKRNTEYLILLIHNFSYVLDHWERSLVFASLIEPLLIISPVFIFTVLGIVIDLIKKKGQNAIILVTAWLAYFIFPLILPEPAVDPRHVFPALIGPSIIAAYGTVEIIKHRKLWEPILFVLIVVQIFYEVKIRKYVQLPHLSSLLLIQLVLVLIIFIILRKVVQTIKLLSLKDTSKARALVLMGLIILLFINGHRLSNRMESDCVRENYLMILSSTQLSLELSGEWLMENTNESSVFMTNEFVRLPYYAGFRTTYQLPENESAIFQEIQNDNIDYLILFWHVWLPKNIYNVYKFVETRRFQLIKMFRWDYPSDNDYSWGFVIIYKIIKDSLE